MGAYNLDPLGADESIFGPGTGVVGPTGLGGRQPVSGWGGRLGRSGPYTLTLTGAQCAPPPDPTPPASSGLASCAGPVALPQEQEAQRG